MQDDQDNGEFPVSDNPRATRPRMMTRPMPAIPARSKSLTMASPCPRFPRHRRARRTPLLPLARVQPLARMPRQHHRQMMTTSPYATFSCGAAFPCLSCC